MRRYVLLRCLTSTWYGKSNTLCLKECTVASCSATSMTDAIVKLQSSCPVILDFHGRGKIGKLTYSVAIKNLMQGLTSAN